MLEAWEPLPAPANGHRVTYWVVPPGSLQVSTADDARAAAARDPAIVAWSSERAAKARSVTRRGLLCFVQWVAATASSQDQGRCAVVDALEGAVSVLGTEDCIP